MRLQRWIPLALLFVFALGLRANAVEAKWHGRLFSAALQAQVEDAGKFKTKLKDKEGNWELDSTSGSGFTLRYGGELVLGATFERLNDHKGKIIPGEGDVEATNQFLGFLATPIEFKKGRIDPVPVTVQTVEPKGKLKVNGKFSKVTVKGTWKFTGVVADGEFAGKAVTGKLKLTYKGDRQ